MSESGVMIYSVFLISASCPSALLNASKVLTVSTGFDASICLGLYFIFWAATNRLIIKETWIIWEDTIPCNRKTIQNQTNNTRKTLLYNISGSLISSSLFIHLVNLSLRLEYSCVLYYSLSFSLMLIQYFLNVFIIIINELNWNCW